jgi:hypothetical protein
MDDACRPTAAHVQALVNLLLCGAALLVAVAAVLIVLQDPTPILAWLAGG